MPIAGVGDRDVDGADRGLDIVDHREHGVVVGDVELAGDRSPRRHRAEGVGVCRLPDRADDGWPSSSAAWAKARPSPELTPVTKKIRW